MSQPKSTRKPTKFDALENAKKIRNVVMFFVLKSFGVKAKVRTPKLLSEIYKMSEEDAAIFVELCERYGMDTITDEYQEWFIGKLRERITESVFNLVSYVQVSAIYPKTISECDCRRTYQNLAISCCNDLYHWLDLAAAILPVDINKFKRYMGLIEKEISLLKGLKKHDNKIRRKLLENEFEAFANLVKNSDLVDNEVTTDMVRLFMLIRGADVTQDWE